jgi:RimJ/RimL family protein N-acetyltransferase
MNKNMGQYLFTTERLKIRELSESDYDSIARQNADPDVMKFINPVMSPEESQGWFQRLMNYKTMNSPLGIWPIELKTGEWIGWVCIKQLDNSSFNELGYRISKDYWGKGYATEASMNAMEFAKEVMGLTELSAVCLPENKASQKVLEKCGFTFLGMDNYYKKRAMYYHSYL